LKGFIKHLDKFALNKFETRFNDFQSSLSQVNTEHKCFVELRKRNYLVDSETITYGYRKELNISEIKYVKNSRSQSYLSII